MIGIGTGSPSAVLGLLVLATKAAAVVGVWCIVTTRRIVSPLSGVTT